MSAVEPSEGGGPHSNFQFEEAGMHLGSEGREIMDVFSRKQPKTRDSNMCSRRIVSEENHSQIFSGARATHV